MRFLLSINALGEVTGPEVFTEGEDYELCSVISADRAKNSFQVILEYSEGELRDVSGEYDSGTIFADNWKD